MEAEVDNLKEAQLHTDQMVAVNEAALAEQTKTVSDYGSIDAEVKALEKRLVEQRESFATFDESLGLMTQELRDQCTGMLTNLEAEAAQLEGKAASLNAKMNKLKAELEQAPQDLQARLQKLEENEKAEIERAVAELR